MRQRLCVPRKQVGHMAAPTSVAEALKNPCQWGPSTQGRFDPFAVPSGNGRYLRKAEGAGPSKALRLTRRVGSAPFGGVIGLAVNAAIGARLAPAGGRGSVGGEYISRQREFGRFAGGLRSKVRKGHS